MATTMLVEDLTNDAYWRGYDAGTENERDRIIEHLLEQNVIRIDAFGRAVFINCNTSQVEYLADVIVKGDKK